MRPVSLVVHEKEELRSVEGTGEVAAELVELQGNFRARLKVIPGVQIVVAQELKQRAVVAIGTGLGDDVHLRSQRESALGAVAAIGKVDLLDAVHACARDLRGFLAFGLKKAVHVAAA